MALSDKMVLNAEDIMEYLTLDEISSQFALELDAETKRLLANALNLIAKKRGDNVQMVRKRTKVNGNYQSYKVTAYPLAYADLFEKLCLLMDVWKDKDVQ